MKKIGGYSLFGGLLFLILGICFDITILFLLGFVGICGGIILNELINYDSDEGDSDSDSDIDYGDSENEGE